MLIDFILVPKGAEYQAVQQGLQRWDDQRPRVFPLPIGPIAVQQHLQHLQQTGQLPDLTERRVLLLGLAGSLSPTYQVGDVLVLTAMGSRRGIYNAGIYNAGIYNAGIYNAGVDNVEVGNAADPDTGLTGGRYECDRALSTMLYQQLQSSKAPSSSFQIAMETGITSDRLLATAQEKQQAGQDSQTSCVDMEGSSVLASMQALGAKASIIRVISDDCRTTIPDLTSAIDAAGNLKFGSMLWMFARQPIAAANLIRGSLAGLQRLQLVTQLLGH